MSLFGRWFASRPYPPELKLEVDRLTEELVKIGKREGFLSERPGAGFNSQCRNIRAREIGKRFDEIGGYELMEFIHQQVRKPLGKDLFAHLEYAWAAIGRWLP